MGFVYKYTDLQDSVVKYIGIVYSERSLNQRIYEHERHDEWCKNKKWKIEYIEFENRTTLEAVESHLITLYKTYNFYNKAKINWGTCEFIPDLKDRWLEYKGTIKIHKINLRINTKKIKHQNTPNKTFVALTDAGLLQYRNKLPQNVFSKLMELKGNANYIKIKYCENEELFNIVKKYIFGNEIEISL